MSASDETIHRANRHPARWRRILSKLWVLLQERFWYVLPDTYLLVALDPPELYKVLEMAARPSTQRLHLRNVFARGRRYFLHQRANGGFRMVTTRKVPWSGRRTSAATVMLVDVDSAANFTTVHLKARFKTTYFLDTFFMPLFITSILVFMPWSVWFILVMIALLFGLSWVGHSFHASLEAYEMMFFIHKALEEHLSTNQPELTSDTADLIIERQQAFPAEWHKFYEEQIAASSPAQE